jgi:hypothetical protein
MSSRCTSSPVGTIQILDFYHFYLSMFLNNLNKLLYLIIFFRCASPINCKVTEINENNLASCSDVDIRIWSGSSGMICCAKKDIKLAPKPCSSFDGRR